MKWKSMICPLTCEMLFNTAHLYHHLYHHVCFSNIAVDGLTLSDLPRTNRCGHGWCPLESCSIVYRVQGAGFPTFVNFRLSATGNGLCIAPNPLLRKRWIQNPDPD